MTKISIGEEDERDVDIYLAAYGIINNIDGHEFQLDIYEEDYKSIIKDISPQFNITMTVVEDDEDQLSPIIVGDVSDEEGNEITNAIFSDLLLLLHAEPKYYIYNPG